MLSEPIKITTGEKDLVGFGSDDINIVGLYGIDSNEAYKLIDDDSLGERSQVSMYPDGKMVFMGSGGADSMQIDIYSFQDNGTLNEPETILDANASISRLGTSIDQFVEEKMNSP